MRGFLFPSCRPVRLSFTCPVHTIVVNEVVNEVAVEVGPEDKATRAGQEEGYTSHPTILPPTPSAPPPNLLSPRTIPP